MKKIYTILLILCSFVLIGQTCPPEGQGRNDKEKTLNKEKNRICAIFADDEIDTIPIETLLNPGYIKDESVPYKWEKLVTIVGYVTLEKMGGSESCNCHAKDKQHWDVHLEVGATPNAKGVDCLIAEVTPIYSQRDRIDWKSFVGKKVMITGRIFVDVEHFHNAVNTNPTGTNLWRRTIIEIHPVINIIIIE